MAERKVKLGISLPAILADWVRAKAKREGRTVSSIIEDALQGLLDPHH